MLKQRRRNVYKVNRRLTSRERENTMLGNFRFAHMYSIYISIVSEHLLLQKTALTSSPSLFQSFVFSCLFFPPSRLCVSVFSFFHKKEKKNKTLPGVVFLLCSVAGQRARISPLPALVFLCFYFGGWGRGEARG